MNDIKQSKILRAHDTYSLSRAPLATAEQIDKMTQEIVGKINIAVRVAQSMSNGMAMQRYAELMAQAQVMPCPICSAFVSPLLAERAGEVFGIMAGDKPTRICPLCWTPLAQVGRSDRSVWWWSINYDAFPGLREHVADVTRRRSQNGDSTDEH